MIVLAPISYGELIDKITILQIKRERILDEAKRVNVAKELEMLEALRRRVDAENTVDAASVADLQHRLLQVNGELWDIEDGKRACERRRDFGDAFVELARQVYLKNDVRAQIKRQINDGVGSSIVEEKSHFQA